jgi:aminoglycoside 6'-N-acetyltransferase I
MKVTYEPMKENDVGVWLQLATKLWGDYETNELKEDLQEVFLATNQQTYLAKYEGVAIGFINVAIRTDYVEGSDGSPTGYLEGIYVEPNYRKQGVAQQLLALGEKWLAENGCNQIGSDTWLDNTDSQTFHQKMGFRKEAVLVHFLKDIRR